MNAKKRRCHDDPGIKRQPVEKRYEDEKMNPWSSTQKRKICVKSNIKHYISESKLSGNS